MRRSRWDLFEQRERFQTVFQNRFKHPVGRDEMNAQRTALIVVVTPFGHVHHVAENDDLMPIQQTLCHARDDFTAACGDEILETGVRQTDVRVLGAFDHEANIVEQRMTSGSKTGSTRALMRLNFGVIAFDLVGALVDDSILFETVDDPSVRNTEAVMSDGFD